MAISIMKRESAVKKARIITAIEIVTKVMGLVSLVELRTGQDKAKKNDVSG